MIYFFCNGFFFGGGFFFGYIGGFGVFGFFFCSFGFGGFFYGRSGVDSLKDMWFGVVGGWMGFFMSYGW